MKQPIAFIICTAILLSCTPKEKDNITMKNPEFKTFQPHVAYTIAKQKADEIVQSMSLQERIEMIGGHNMFFVNGVPAFNLPELYLSDATQGVHLRKDLDSQLEKSVAMPCPIMLAATWNRQLAHDYAQSIGEECRAGDIAVLLGPGMNIYRIAQNGRNFEYFGEDPYLAARMIENYVVGMQSTGTITTLKHFICNNTDFRRRNSNSIVSERALHEIYLPAFKAGVDAGAMAVMTSYNKVNGEWSGQSDYVISKLLRHDLGFKWLVMSDWWSVWDPEKAIKSGLDLDMPGECKEGFTDLEAMGDVYLRSNAQRLLTEGKISEADINRMAGNIITTMIAMGLDQRPVKDSTYLQNFPHHETIALQTAREGIVLLKNAESILPISVDKRILATGKYMTEWARGGGSAEVEGYDVVNLIDALKAEFGNQIEYIEKPGKEELKNFDVILVSIGTFDSEGWDKSFDLPKEVNDEIEEFASINPNVVVLVNSGSGVNMTPWADKVNAILYGWYPGQMGNQAIAEVLSGKVNPSGKLPITIERNFEDSPGYPYLPDGEKLYTGWELDMKMKLPTYDVVYNEGVFVGYRWYEAENIVPLFHFGHGLSYTNFAYSNLSLSTEKLKEGEKLTVQFDLENTGNMEGSEVAQLYIQDVDATVERPVKELKDFIKVKLQPGEKKRIELTIDKLDLSFYDETSSSWKAEAGIFNILIGTSSDQTELMRSFELMP